MDDDWEWHARMSAWEEEVDARAEAAIARRNERALLGKSVPTLETGGALNRLGSKAHPHALREVVSATTTE